jgi:xylulokinase
MQIQADVLNMPVIIPKVYDGTAIGTAILASVGSGYYSSISKGITEMVKHRTPITPDPEKVIEYDKHYRNWMDTRKSLSQI